MRNNYFRSCNPGIGVAFVAVAHWPAGRLPGVSSQRGAGQQRVITRYTSPPLISPKSSEYKMQLEDNRKKFGYLHFNVDSRKITGMINFFPFSTSSEENKKKQSLSIALVTDEAQ